MPATKIPAELHARSALFRSMLASRRVLVVLDNAAGVDQVRPLLPGTPGCLALITSRSHLAGLSTREGAQRLPLDVLAPDQAVHLLRRIIGADRVDAEPDQARDLARCCGHLPLALRIAADRAASDPRLRLADLVAELADERYRLDVLATSDDPATAVRAVFSWSYRRLPEPAARAFRLLGLHPGPVIALQVAAVLLDLPVSRARRVLDTLTGQHLVQHSGRDRYRFHDLLGVYAAERADLDQPPHSRDRAIGRMLAWYLHAASTACGLLVPHGGKSPLGGLDSDGPPPVSFADRSQVLAWFEQERPNLVAAVRQAAESGQTAAAWKLAYALSPFLLLRWYPDDWRTVLDTGLTTAQHHGDKTGQAVMLTLHSDQLYEWGRYQESIEITDQLLPLSQQLGNRWIEGFCHNRLGLIHTELGKCDTATEHLQRALLIFRDISERRGEGIVLLNLGAAHLRLGQLDTAIDCNQRAATILEETQNPDSRGLALRQLGEAYGKDRRYDEAIGHYQKALTVLRDTGARRQIGITLAELGELCLSADQTDRGRQCLHEALTILTPLDYSGTAAIRKLLVTASSDPGPTTS